MSDSSSRKIAVVTGASSGIGAVYADRLAGQVASAPCLKKQAVGM
jgi:NADP-dependent 3-hydroxy acid dehydrogenase YdfG